MLIVLQQTGSLFETGNKQMIRSAR